MNAQVQHTSIVAVYAASPPDGSGLRVVGTGFIVAKTSTSTFILTAAHVLDDAPAEQAWLVHDRPVRAVHRDSDETDHAVLEVEGDVGGEPLRLGGSEFSGQGAGDSLYADVVVWLGQPLNGGRRLQIAPHAARIVGWSSVETAGGNRQLYRHVEFTDGTLAEPGGSGSPVLDEERGEVVAIFCERQDMHNLALDASAAYGLIADVHRKEMEAQGVRELREAMSELIPGLDRSLPDDLREQVLAEVRHDRLFALRATSALVFGHTGVGKSTTINRLLGTEAIPVTGELTCTRSIMAVEPRKGLTVYDSPGLFDEPEPENLTRVALNLTQSPEEPADLVRLVDLTPEHRAGPQDGTRKIMAYADFRDQIPESYYEQHHQEIAFSRFPVGQFGSWAQDTVDFLVYVTSSINGLPKPELRLLADLYDRRGEDLVLLKVYNLWDDPGFDGTEASARPGSLAKRDQAAKRLAAAGVPDPGSWIIVNSASGVGIGRIVAALAESLPPAVLRSLKETVDEQFADVIERRLHAVFFEYAFKVASVLATLPADYRLRDQELLHQAFAGLITVADYLYTRSGAEVATEVFDDVLNEMLRSKREAKYKTRRVKKKKKVQEPVSETTMVYKPVPNKFTAFLERNFAVDLHPYKGVPETRVKMVERTETRYKKKRKFVGYVYRAGGATAVMLTVAFARTLADVYQTQGPAKVSLKDTLDANQNALLAAVPPADLEKIQAIAAAADELDHTRARLDLANTRMLPLIREVFAGRVADVL